MSIALEDRARRPGKPARETAKTTRGPAIGKRLAEAILEGRLRPGDRLTEAMLARRFKVSRTPIREALRELAASGLIEMRPHRGAQVRALPLETMVHMLEVMAELEGFCARLAARRMSDAQRRELARLHKDYRALAAADDRDGYFQVSMRFHELIYAGSQNPVLEATAMRIRLQVSAYRRFQLRAPGRLEQSLAEHTAILEAIVARDAEAADRLMREHINIVGETFADLVATLPAGMAGR
jgi:DNA-binding GntR family transcriptional regulator